MLVKKQSPSSPLQPLNKSSRLPKTYLSKSSLFCLFVLVATNALGQRVSEQSVHLLELNSANKLHRFSEREVGTRH
jgi:hypothetical protein